MCTVATALFCNPVSQALCKWGPAGDILLQCQNVPSHRTDTFFYAYIFCVCVCMCVGLVRVGRSAGDISQCTSPLCSCGDADGPATGLFGPRRAWGSATRCTGCASLRTAWLQLTGAPASPQTLSVQTQASSCWQSGPHRRSHSTAPQLEPR